MNLETIITNFLAQRGSVSLPLLVGFSGGEDSLALADCLHRLSIQMVLAHFDHGWRDESKEEAQALKGWAMERGIPFLSQRANEPNYSEAGARDQRYRFFSEILSENPFEALVLGHHRGDQAETVLKRVFEGAHLTSLAGIKSCTHKENMVIWRPILACDKCQIRDYISQHALTPIDDPSNRDDHYLRARMRSSLLPLLSKEFGKEILPSLIRLGKYGAELENYLASQTDKYRNVHQRGPFGEKWDFRLCFPLPKLEMRFLLERAFGQGGVSLSVHTFDQIYDSLASLRANQKIKTGKVQLVADRGVLYWLKKKPPQFTQPQSLEEKTFTANGWRWEIALSESEMRIPPLGEGWWTGQVRLSLPLNRYDLVPPGAKHRKKWSKKKVPAFIRNAFPVIEAQGEIVADFFEGAYSNDKNNLLVTLAVSSRE